MSEPIDIVLSKLDAVKAINGHSWIAKCPAHDDRSPSLSISTGDTSRVLLNCHAGCTTNDIVDAIGMKIRDLFVRTTESAKRKIVDTYDYCDADGELLMQVVRYDPKDFRQRRPDGRGGWTWKLGDLGLVPYRLPELWGADPTATVFICEGEKDCDAMVAAGYVATCGPMGAGKWRKVDRLVRQVVAGRDVMVIADRDEAGIAHARDVAKSLHGVAADVTVCEAAVGKDAADHLGAGRTVAEFVIVASTDLEVGAEPLDQWRRDAPETEPLGDTPHGAEGLAPLDWHVLFARDRAPADWLVDGVWPRGRMISLTAPRKARKSLFMLYLATRLASGRCPWTGREVDPVRVAYFDYEMSEDDVLERLEDMQLGPDDLANLRYFLHPAMPMLDTPEGGKALLDVVETHDPAAIVIDTYSRVVTTKDNTGHETREFYRWSAQHVKARGCSIGRLDHTGHGDQTRAVGTAAKGADVDVGWVIHPGDAHTMSLRHHGLTRMSWVPERIDLEWTDSPLAFRRSARTYIAGTAECAADLDALGVPTNVSGNEAQRLLKDAGKGRNRKLVLDAVAYRQERP